MKAIIQKLSPHSGLKIDMAAREKLYEEHRELSLRWYVLRGRDWVDYVTGEDLEYLHKRLGPDPNPGPNPAAKPPNR